MCPHPQCWCSPATQGFVALRRRPSSLYSRKPENSAVQERSRNSMKILRVSPAGRQQQQQQQEKVRAGTPWRQCHVRDACRQLCLCCLQDATASHSHPQHSSAHRWTPHTCPSPQALRSRAATNSSSSASPALTLDAFCCCLEGLIAHKVLLVVVVLELSAHCLQLSHVQVGVDLLAEQLLHLVKVTVDDSSSRSSSVGERRRQAQGERRSNKLASLGTEVLGE